MNNITKTITDVVLLLLLSPFWLCHYLILTVLFLDRSWTMQNSIDLAWGGGQRLDQTQRLKEYFDYEIALEEARLGLPKPLYMADIYLHDGRIQQARDEVETYLVEHPGDDKALQILAKIEGRS